MSKRANQDIDNTDFLMAEVNWLKQVIKTRFDFWQKKEETKKEDSEKIHPLDIINQPPDETAAVVLTSKAEYPTFIRAQELQPIERIAIILAMTPYLAPQVLDVFFAKNAKYSRPFTEFGGLTLQQHKGFLPTWETFYFIVAGNNLKLRLELENYFHYSDKRLFKKGILSQHLLAINEPLAAMQLSVTQRFLKLAIFENEDYIPSFGHQFPAELYRPKLEWEDLVLTDKTLAAVAEIKDWITHHKKIFANERASKMLQPGYRALFYGPPGTGKSLTAGLLGKETGKLVFRVDLSKVISKYIGETEKNLSNIFDQAEHNDWILFFDEADALFGKRVKTNDAKDRYANQETAYLLQRIENYPGVVVLASNQVGNMDKAFSRRFQTVVHFPKPGPFERRILWANTFFGFDFDPADISLEQLPDFWKELASQHELTGANIQNVLRKSLLMAYSQNSGLLKQHFLGDSISHELEKSKRI